MSPAANPTRTIVQPEDLRTLTDQSQINLRNFRILKDYVVALEYYVEAFTYFKSAWKSYASVIYCFRLKWEFFFVK